MSLPVLYIIIPCYNEQEVLPVTAPMFLGKLTELTEAGKISDKSRVMFVNDGSKDKTWEIIRALSEQDGHFIGISQSRNRGHQNALWAGLMESRGHCDITITIDCDGQDDINAMDAMVDEYLGGRDVDHHDALFIELQLSFLYVYLNIWNEVLVGYDCDATDVFGILYKHIVGNVYAIVCCGDVLIHQRGVFTGGCYSVPSVV